MHARVVADCVIEIIEIAAHGVQGVPHNVVSKPIVERVQDVAGRVERVAVLRCGAVREFDKTFGVVVILAGLLLNALQFQWRGELRRWLATDAGILVAYLGIIGAFIDGRLFWALPAGIVWALAGAAVLSPQDRLGALGQAAGEAIERILQLGVNTVSFVRVGAFALAHAGLCVAVVGIAEAAGPAYWPVLVLGNAAIVALEGLVVGIQTTRLILFEFFIRFLSARGRPFEPLLPPPPPSEPMPRSKP
jgi:V/A-type H+-transporting ATPase subunit I